MPPFTTAPTRPAGADAALRPAEADPRGSFERAAARLRAAGLRVSAWAVLAHGCGLGAGNPSWHVRNAYGDGYPWALCIGSPEVRDYVAALAAEVAALGDAGAVELEACGWYGIDHGSVHDKTAGAAVGPAAEWLLSVCFCPACADAYRQAGADPEELRSAVRAALDGALGWGGAAASRAPADAGELPGLRRRRRPAAVRGGGRAAARPGRRWPSARHARRSRRCGPRRRASRCSCTRTPIRARQARTPVTTQPCCSVPAAPTASC